MTKDFARKKTKQDTCFSLMIKNSKIRSCSRLIIADENLRKSDLEYLPSGKIVLITNRFDIYEQAKVIGLDVFFNDFDFSVFPNNTFLQVLFRVSKEKALTHHIIKSTYRVLFSNGELVLGGSKGDGIKTYAEKASEYFGTPVKTKKDGSVYVAVATRSNLKRDIASRKEIDDQNYSVLRECVPFQNDNLVSKPGLFGWGKIDEGSKFLSDFIPDFLTLFHREPKDILDLGCGYGYLSIRASQLTGASIVATDNNAAAILACSKNFIRLNINGAVIADDCGKNIKRLFDAVICNPPFHKGFGADAELTQKFVLSSFNHLRKGGMALLVVNSFIPLEKYTEKKFHAKLIAKNKSFKLILLQK